MHSTSPPLNPSQAVERIREIIVGRQIERLEQRIAKLEAPASRHTTTDLTPLEDRMLASEARLEALHAHVTRLSETHREENDRRTLIQREETQRLAAQIQQVAATRMAAAASTQDISGLERKLGAWLGDWQKSLSLHLDAREHKMTEKLRAELSQLWENIEGQLTKLQSRTLDHAAIEQRFNKIAEAARALAECASTPVEIPASPR